MRLSSNPPKTCTFNLFWLNIEFRLFVFDNEEKKDEVQVDTIALAPADDVEIKDGKYTGKLTVKLNVEGDNLNDLKAEDLIAKITYRSGNQQGANIDFTTNKNDFSDKAVTGSYEHSFEVSNIKVENTLGNTAELSFELNLDGVSLEDFPKDFLVEFYSKGSDENTRPFEYTQTFSFETKENEPDPEPQPEPEPEPDPDNPDQPSVIYAITYNLDGGQLTKDNPSNYTVETESFTLTNPTKDDYFFLGWTYEGQTTPHLEVTITKGSTTGNKAYTANWKLNLTLTIASDTGSVFEPLANNLYKLKPTFTITPVFAAGTVITDTEKNNILGAISVKDSNSTALNTISKSWENGKITLSFSEALTASSTYTISFDDIDGVNFTYTPLSFTTICFSGSGTSESPFLVSTAEQLDLVRKFPSYHFKQMNDITLTSANWTPIGKENYSDFYGKYDGNHHKIIGLKIINNDNANYVGLFSRLDNSAIVQNLTIENVDIKGNMHIGGLAGEAAICRIENVHISGNINIKGSSSVGGLAGQCSNVEFSRCSVDSPDGLISAGTGYDVGGLAGRFDVQSTENSSISESYASIKVQGNNCVGGLVGNMKYCIIENSYSDCEITVTGNSPYAFGGLVGGVNADNARFTNCYSKGTIKIESTEAGDVGGLCGNIQSRNQNYQNSTNSFTYVTISVPQDYTVSGYEPYNPDDVRGKVPLYYSDPAGYTYVYSPDNDNHNYLSNGYPASGLTWSSDVWSGLSEGAYPTLINNPPPAQP